MLKAQEIINTAITPTLKGMGSNYNTGPARFLLICTAAIESDLGRFKRQIGGGPAVGLMQMEPETCVDIWLNCDALGSCENLIGFEASFSCKIDSNGPYDKACSLLLDDSYSVLMARLKYAMDPKPLPKLTGDFYVDSKSFYDYYKRVYNTELGASTFEKWTDKLEYHKIREVEL